MTYVKKYPIANEDVLEYTKGQEDRIESQFSLIVDFVVDSGNNYQKWNSGKLEQYVSIRADVIMNISWGAQSSLYYADVAGISFPIPFKSIPYIWYNLDQLSGFTITNLIKNSRVSASNTGSFYLVRDGKAAPTQSVAYINVLAIGTWK